MKNLALLLIMASGVTASQANACDAISGSSIDIAESNLRIVLNRSADGSELPRSLRTGSAKLKSMNRLLQLEQSTPGLLNGKLVPCFQWPQHEEVKRLYNDMQESLKD